MPDRILDARSRRLLLLVLAYVGFVSLGLPDGLLGVAAPSILREYRLVPADIGALLTAFTAGYLLSSFGSGWLLRRMTVGTLLASSCLATATSLVGYAVSPWWALMVLGGTLSGLGAGAIDAGINTWVATRHGARTINWLHAFYGIGASGGPLVMSAVLAAGWPWRAGYAIVGLGQLALATWFAATRELWVDARAPSVGDAEPAQPATRPHATAGDTLRLPIVWLSIALFFVYTGLEATAGVWTYSMLTEARGVPAGTAGLWVSFFWLGLTGGRFAFGALVGRAALRLLLRATISLIALGAALVAFDLGTAATLAGIVLCGLAMAPVFPSFIAVTPSRLGEAHTANGVGFQIAAAVLGAAALPTLVGVLVGRFGLDAFGPALFAGAVLLFVLHEAAARRDAVTAQPIG
jgi:fucose permease